MKRNLIIQVSSAIIFLCLIIVAVASFMHFFPSKPVLEIAPSFSGYDVNAMQKAVSPDKIDAQLDTILSFGSRFVGQMGSYRTEDYIRKEYSAAGLKVIEQSVPTVAPVTVRREILSKTGTPLLGVELYPFLPNGFQPVFTPDSGCSGRLVLLNDSTINTIASFGGCIGVIDSNPPQDYRYDCIKYTKLGLKAIIVSHPKGFDKVDWASISNDRSGEQLMICRNPINIVRLAANEKIYRYIDSTVTLHIKSEYQAVPTTTILGKLEGIGQKSEAIIVACGYDAFGLLPDRSPGVIQAFDVAEHLCLLKGILPYRDSLKRDVYFLSYSGQSMAFYPLHSFIAAMGLAWDRPKLETELKQKKQGNADSLSIVRTISTALANDSFLIALDPTLALMQKWNKETVNFFRKQVLYVINDQLVGLGEEKLQAKIAMDREGQKDLKSPAAVKYRKVKKRYDKLFSASGYPLEKLIRDRGPVLKTYNIKKNIVDWFDELKAFHERNLNRIDQDIVINKTFSSYKSVVVYSPHIVPSTGTIDIEKFSYSSSPSVGKEFAAISQGSNFNGIFNSAIQRLDLTGKLEYKSSEAKNHDLVEVGVTVPMPQPSVLWSRTSYYAVDVYNLDRFQAYSCYSFPVELPFQHNIMSMEKSFRASGEALLSTAFGNGELKESQRLIPYSFNGVVYIGEQGQSVIPSHPAKNAIISGEDNRNDQSAAYFNKVFLITDVYGRYSIDRISLNFCYKNDYNATLEPDAVLYGKEGRIAFIKDRGLKAQSIYKSLGICTNCGVTQRFSVNLILFRGDPVSVLDMVNPQTLSDYSGATFIKSKGLVPFDNENIFDKNNFRQAFMPPEEPFFVLLQSGMPGNDRVSQTRAFILGNMDSTVSSLSGAFGTGLYAMDNEIITDVPFQVAASMNSLNKKRLVLQKKFQMADEQTLAFQEKAETQLAKALDKKTFWTNALQFARNSVSYSTLNYPVIRQNISEAVFGILWYLALLVPFVFFFEKLVFGFSDIRKQIIAQAIIFLCVFLLLRALHPAFLMIRSSMMILLGFIIFMISTGITLLFAGKFGENLEELKKKQGKVSAANVDTFGVMGTAFLLGLNNMHRRKVRTGLTCATLVLITVVMICFTSMQSSIVDKAFALGKAPYQGFLVNHSKMTPIDNSQFSALQSKYFKKFDVIERLLLMGAFDPRSDKRLQNAEISVTYESKPDQSATLIANSILQFSYKEPLRDKIELVSNPVWFSMEQEQANSGEYPVMISEVMAQNLSLSVEKVNAGGVPITLNGTKVKVIGIFKSESLTKLRDLDGKTLLPMDVEAVPSVEAWDPWGTPVILVNDDSPRIDAEKIILCPLRPWGSIVSISAPLLPRAGMLKMRRTSIAVVFNELGYKDAREVINEYLEQSQKETYYGLDGISYLGQRTRSRSLAGLLEMLIPLFIAALTVLNTMRGSVYERRDEIFVYNAVGVAPKYIAFMFFAEAFVYSVVGTVLGYIISQGLGRVLTELHLTGGLNMTFTSAMSIYASIVIAIAVFISTYFPARTAMDIASPADESGWSLPEPQGGILVFELPFTFSYRDRIAILAFFNRYFLDNGEGSAGKFYAGTPVLGINMEQFDPLANDAYIPQISVPIWLKPFDLGVSQELTITLATDPETSEYKACITLNRLSGTLEAWKQLNNQFVMLLRRHFLIWRAVPDSERKEMFEESKKILEQNIAQIDSTTAGLSNG